MVEFTSEEKWQLRIVLTGTLDVINENTLGSKRVLGLSGGVTGTCLRAEAPVTVDREITSYGIHFWGGRLNGFVLLSTCLGDRKFEFNLISGWQFR